MTDKNTPRGAVVVTGVSTGIGRAIAEDLVDAGYLVFGSVRRLADAQPLADRFGLRFIPLVFDVTDADALPGAVETVSRQLHGQGLSALVNNAGISVNGPVMHQPLEEFRKTFEVNVFGALQVARAFLPLLGAGGPPVARPGRIVNIGSVQGAIAVPFMAAYSVSKHALEALSQVLRRELVPYGIEVSTIEPGFIRTSIFQKAAAMLEERKYDGTDYEAMWHQFNRSLLSQEAKAKPPQRVTRAVLHAIEARKPRTRYPLDPIWYIGRCLPDRAFDRLVFKAFGIDRLMRARPN